MEQKKRKKVRKKNRSGQVEEAQEAAPLPPCEDPDITVLNRERYAITAAEAAGADEIASNEPLSVLQESRFRPADRVLSTVDFQQIVQIVQELRSAFDSEARNSPALCVLLNDIKASHATSLANLGALIEQLTGELVDLKQVVHSQNSKEVDLDADIQGIREEVSQLKAIKKAESERKEAEYLEIQLLREEIAKLTECSSKQLQMVEVIVNISQQLLKHEQPQSPMGLNQLTDNSAVQTPFAGDTPEEQSGTAEAVVMDSSMVSCGKPGSEVYRALVPPQLTKVASATLADELQVENPEKVNGYHVLMNPWIQQESNTDQQGEQSKCYGIETNHLGARKRDVPTIYEETERSKKDEVNDSGSIPNNTKLGKQEQGDDPGLFDDKSEFVSVPDRQEEENLQHDFASKKIHSEMSLHGQLQFSEFKPLSDAPITGAPIRLFKFVARYVSGADLVE